MLGLRGGDIHTRTQIYTHPIRLAVTRSCRVVCCHAKEGQKKKPQRARSDPEEPTIPSTAPQIGPSGYASEQGNRRVKKAWVSALFPGNLTLVLASRLRHPTTYSLQFVPRPGLYPARFCFCFVFPASIGLRLLSLLALVLLPDLPDQPDGPDLSCPPPHGISTEPGPAFCLPCPVG